MLFKIIRRLRVSLRRNKKYQCVKNNLALVLDSYLNTLKTRTTFGGIRETKKSVNELGFF